MATTQRGYGESADRSLTASGLRLADGLVGRHTRRRVLLGAGVLALAGCLPRGAAVGAEEAPGDGGWPPRFLAQAGKDPLAPGIVNGPLGVAFGPGGHLWVPDSVLHRIQVFAEGGRLVAMMGEKGSAPGQFLRPTGIAFSDAGDAYVVDSGNARVQVFDRAGTYLRSWGGAGDADGQFGLDGGPSFRGATGIALASDGTVYVTDTINHRVQAFDPAGGHLATWAEAGAAGPMRFPRGVAVSPAGGTVYVADTVNRRVLAFNRDGQMVRVVMEQGDEHGQNLTPTGLATAADGTVWVADYLQHRAVSLRPDGTARDRLTAGDRFNPIAVAVGPQGDVAVVDPDERQVRRFLAGEQYEIQTWGSQRDADGLVLPHAVAFAPDGASFCVTDSVQHRVLRFGLDGAERGLVGLGGPGQGPGEFIVPLGVTAAPDGTVYVADSGNHRVQAFDAAGGFLRQWGAEGDGPSQFVRPRTITVSLDGGRVYVGDVTGRIQEFDPWGAPKGMSRFHPPQGDAQLNGFAVAPDGSFLVSDATPEMVFRFGPNWSMLGAWDGSGPGDSPFAGIEGVAATPDGSVITVERSNHRLRWFDLDGQFQREFDGIGGGRGSFAYPDGVAVSPDGRHLVVADTGNDRAQVFSLDAQVVG